MKYVEKYRKGSREWWGIDLPRIAWLSIGAIYFLTVLLALVR